MTPRSALRRRILPFTLRNDPERVVRQRPLQRQSIGRLRLEPPVGFVGRGQDDRYGVRVDRRNYGVGLSRQKPKQLVMALNRRALGAAYATPGRP
jgi:hypothetical protein